MKLDVPTKIRNGEDIDNDRLTEYLSRKFNSNCSEIEVLQFPSGYSNLTYLIKFNESEYVLRRPPFGAKVKSGHDMSREYKILSILKNKFSKAPKPILFCDDEKVIGSLETLTISSCLVRAQKPGSKSRLSSCQYIGASSRSLLKISNG